MNIIIRTKEFQKSESAVWKKYVASRTLCLISLSLSVIHVFRWEKVRRNEPQLNSTFRDSEGKIWQKESAKRLEFR